MNVAAKKDAIVDRKEKAFAMDRKEKAFADLVHMYWDEGYHDT
jgi:hypothetical protein